MMKIRLELINTINVTLSSSYRLSNDRRPFRLLNNKTLKNKHTYYSFIIIRTLLM